MVRPLRAGRVESSQGQRSIVSPQTVAPMTMPSMTMTPSRAIHRGMFLSRRWSEAPIDVAIAVGRIDSPIVPVEGRSRPGQATARERARRSALFGPCQTRDELDPEEARQFAPLRLGET